MLSFVLIKKSLIFKLILKYITTRYNVSLKNKNYMKYLGILIDCHLTWKYHIDYIATKTTGQLVSLLNLDIL